MAVSNDVLATDLEALANLYTLQAVLINMQANLELISAGATGKTITVTNANLCKIAAKEYGDATQWTTIAKANGLKDWLVQGGSISQVLISNKGAGYRAPVVGIIGNAISTANLQAVVVGGEIVEIKVVTAGQYVGNVSVLITDATGTGAAASAVCAFPLVIPNSGRQSGGILTS